MNVSKYLETGNEIKTLSSKLQALTESNPVNDQFQIPQKKVSPPMDASSNLAIVVAGLVMALILGTFILLHFW